ncbi:HDOD domain-containing protein [Pelagicoccus mobilis]|uniref:HDOD domain-containing protein n=1 Tax=Pelagicoccus mobilis TaxID=415221 RepID=A0A934VMP9_9BACT|nr:HDOD domain-containing protein [Pelagicoccus mobilis]MBK1875407.1 HDOD domain-containing protein [Pelagicoccus mobilis]
MQNPFPITQARGRPLPSDSDWRGAFLSCIEAFPTPTDKSRALYFYTQDQYADLDGAASLIRKDPFLSVEVVRSSNSAVYGSRGADSLEDAVNAIGLERLGRIALRIWLKNVIPQSLATYFLSGSSFVNRSLASGAAMRYLYQGETEQAETAYAIGLLHSIGKIVVNEAVKQSKMKDLCFEEKTLRRLAEAERAEFGMTHAEVGSYALKSWGFSESVYAPIGVQFSKNKGEDSDDWAQSLAVSRFVADRVIDSIRGNPDPMRSEAASRYRGIRLGDVFESTLAVVEAEMIEELN